MTAVSLSACTAISKQAQANNSNNMATKKENSNESDKPVTFYQALAKALQKRKLDLDVVCPPGNPVARRVLEDYGAMFLTSDDVMPPPVCIFTSESEVTKFQNETGFATERVGGAQIQLQRAAMKALLKARAEANKAGLDITPRGGTEAARRDYGDSLRLWNTRFLPALDHWIGKGRLTKKKAAELRALPLSQQVTAVLELEQQGIFFSKDFSKSILYSIAAPGTSQHIAMLALDVEQFQNVRVREILARHGWFQSVRSDLPHFTFLGLDEKELPQNGLRGIVVDGQRFWIPNVSAAP
jgi:hypothetical protein